VPPNEICKPATGRGHFAVPYELFSHVRQKFVIPLLLTALALSGCHRQASSKVSPGEQAAFNQAVPEIKELWDKALEADKANDYFAAESFLYKLLGQASLTPEQRSAAEKESTDVKRRLDAAAEKGDPAAKAALQQLRSNLPNRQR